MSRLIVIVTDPRLAGDADEKSVRSLVGAQRGMADIVMLGHSSQADAWVFKDIAVYAPGVRIVQFLPNNMRRDYALPDNAGKRTVKAGNWQGRQADLAMVRAAAKAADAPGWEVYFMVIKAPEDRAGHSDLWPVEAELTNLHMQGNEYVVGS